MKIYFKYFVVFLIGAVISLTTGLLFFEVDFDTLKQFGKIFGFVSVISYILSLSSGIIKRLEIPIKTTALLLARQQLGILMFVSAFAHYILSALKTIILPILAVGGTPKLSASFVFGFLALLVALPMFLTSNNWVKRKIKTYWTKLHLLTHILGWLIFGHLIFREISLISILLLITISADVYSLVRRSKN